VSLSFFVPGIPVSQGSKRAFVIQGKDGRHRPVLSESAANLKPWRAAIAYNARRAMIDAKHSGWFHREPLCVRMRFLFLRPASTPKIRLHVVRPDVSKLLRAAEDALTAVLYGDASQIVAATVEKAYAGDLEGAGVEVTVGKVE